MRKTSTKRALFTSVMALLLCFAMLLGTTFAWFTDSASSTGNKIVAGTLDVNLLMYDDAQGKYIDISESGAPIFGDGALAGNDRNTKWEPGKTQVVYLAIENAGNLDLKYDVLLSVTDSVKDLYKAMRYTITPDAQATDAALPAWDAAAAKEVVPGTQAVSDANVLLGAEKTHYFALSIHMLGEAGNEFQKGEITFDLTVRAAQVASEDDSFGNGYDADAVLDFYPVSTASQFKYALENLPANTGIMLTKDIVVADDLVIADNVVINGNGHTITRANGTSLFALSARATAAYDGPIFTVEAGKTLVLENIIIDGGAVWTGEINEVLQRGTVNSGITATGALVATEANAHLVLGEGAILQNNDGANAVNLGTRIGATLTINGGEIINNHSAAGAIWGGGEITLNSGKINGNHGGIGGAIRVVTNIGTVLTMNGGEMNHNYSDGNGGAIWAGSSKSNNVYVLNGGEMAYNYSAATGGAIYAGYYETVKIGGTFKMHDNSCSANIGAEIRFHDHAILVMTGGEVSNEADNAFYLNNNSATITGGKYVGNLGYSGGLGLVLGEAEIEGVISYNLGTNHNTAYLAAEFGTFRFTVNESASNFAQFNFKPAEGYTYAEGDEAKLICLNEGYTTYWDEATSSFRLMAD